MFTACWKFLLGFILFGAMISHIGQLKGEWDWFLFVVVSLVGLTWLLQGGVLFLTGIFRGVEGVLRASGKLPKEASPQEEKEQIRQELAGFAAELDKNLRSEGVGTVEGKVHEGVTLAMDVKGTSKEVAQPYIDKFLRKMAKRGLQFSVEIKEKQ